MACVYHQVGKTITLAVATASPPTIKKKESVKIIRTIVDDT